MNVAPLRGVFVGSGSDGLKEPIISAKILELATKCKRSLSGNLLNDTDPIVVVYLGTATYDSKTAEESQTGFFRDAGCEIVPLYLATQSSPHASNRDFVQKTLKRAHIIIASGGNTQFAVRRWIDLDIRPFLEDAMKQGTVLAGGSAGAICWFDGGHSDSADPATWISNSSQSALFDQQSEDDSSATPISGKVPNQWNYIRVSGLSLYPGLVCPHHDRTQSNGRPRSIDFDEMLKQRHHGEVGLCIDHWAALVIDGDQYEVITAEHNTDTGTPIKTGNVLIKKVQHPTDSEQTESIKTRILGKGTTEELLNELQSTIIHQDLDELSLNEKNPTPS